ncbi:MAG: peptidylprolyl isomerase [Bacteroidota bacterium]
MKQIFVFLFLFLVSFAAQAQTISQIKKVLDTTQDPIGYVKYKLKKKYRIDTVTIVSTNNFMGLADSLAYKGKVGKTYGPFKNANYLVKILAKIPNTFYRVSHILIDTTVFKVQFADSLADKIMSRIKSDSSSFQSMARTYSADNTSMMKGGDLGWFIRGIMLPQLEKAIVSHKKGDIFKVWTPAGLHVVTVTDNPKKDHGFALLLRVLL